MLIVSLIILICLFYMSKNYQDNLIQSLAKQALRLSIM